MGNLGRNWYWRLKKRVNIVSGRKFGNTLTYDEKAAEEIYRLHMIRYQCRDKWKENFSFEAKFRGNIREPGLAPFA